MVAIHVMMDGIHIFGVDYKSAVSIVILFKQTSCVIASPVLVSVFSRLQICNVR